MKARQGVDQSVESIAVVAGNCIKGAPTTGAAAEVPFTDTYWPNTFSLAVWNNGQAIYYRHGQALRKILAGQAYPTSVECAQWANVYYARGKLYLADGVLREITPALDGPEGEGEQPYLGRSTEPGCLNDGVDRAHACPFVGYTVASDPQGRLLFVDGLNNNGVRDYRIRFVDERNTLQTALGSLPFNGAGLDKQLVRAAFAGIHYKSLSAPNQQAFPAGLYFIDSGSPLLGYMDPTSGVTAVLWGNQQLSDLVHPSGTAIGPGLGLGWVYHGGDAQSLTFDAEGLPWLRYAAHLARVDGQRQVEQLQGAGLPGDRSWWYAVDGDDPALFNLEHYGAQNNLALKDGGVFLLGNGDDSSPAVKLSYFDFAAGTVTELMGGRGSVPSADNSTPGAARNLSFWNGCRYHCYIAYRADEDRLYYSELSKLRYLTAPTDPARSTLATLFDTGGSHIKNFSFSPDGSQLFYLMDGSLHCHDLGSGKAWCNDGPLGPPPGLEIEHNGPNQLTWIDPTQLLISSYSSRGQIYRYMLEP